MEIVDRLIAQLNEEQLKPVLDTEGAVLVIAGAGSGKTRVLTTRIAHLISNKKVSAEKILAITFTNKAAGEMKERLKKIFGNIGDMWICTIHSMCVRILRRDIDKIGFDKNFTIYDETDKDRVLKRVIDELGLEADDYFKSAKNLISTAKNDCISPIEFVNEYRNFRKVEQISKIYEKYSEYLEKSNSLDFDDLLFKTYKLFTTHPEVVDYYASAFEYIHIDEFQDTNKVQFLIAQMLASKHQNIFVVGDDDQSIYGWRGAKIENILNFDDIYRGVKIYKLQKNYRSTKKILELANCIIKNNTERRDKELWTDNDDGCRVETFVGNDENNEASYVALQIKNLMNRNQNLKYKDFAVFIRLNALSRAFEQEFLKYGIPYTIFGGFRFFERKEIKDVLAYLKVINNNLDNESFLRAVACPKRGIGDKTLAELSAFASSMHLSIFDAIDFIDQTALSSGAKNKLTNFKNTLNNFIDYSRGNAVVNLIKYILEKTDFLAQFQEDTEENMSKKYNISELLNSADEFYKNNPNTHLSEYLASITLSSDTDSIQDGDVVTIATIHSAKGLEYPTVFVAGCDESILPAIRGFHDESELEEERRLMYVAITRAKQRLYLTRANSRYMYGKREYMTQSRFLKEGQSILNPLQYQNNTTKESPYSFAKRYEESLDINQPSNSGGGYSSNYAKRFLSNTKPTSNAKSNVASYKTGLKVKHVKFGEGVVIMTKGEGDNLVVDVAFKGVGIKSLSAKYAPMEIING